MTDERKVQLSLAIIIIALTFGAHKLVLSGRIDTNKRLLKSNTQIQDGLLDRNRNWTLQPDYLRTLNAEYKKNRDQRFSQVTSAFIRANDEFKKLYDPTNVGISVQQWRDGLMVFSFGEMFWDVKNSLKDRGIHLNDDVLNLTDKKTVPRQRLYRQLAHLHVVRELVLTAQKHQLILSHPDMTAEWRGENAYKEEFSVEPAMVTVLSPRSYFIPNPNPEVKQEAYLDEFPVEIRVRGKLSDLTRFLHELTSGNNYLPLDRIQIKAIGADRFIKYNTNMLNSENQVEARLICSGFLILRDLDVYQKQRLERIRKKKPLPKGA